LPVIRTILGKEGDQGGKKTETEGRIPKESLRYFRTVWIEEESLTGEEGVIFLQKRATGKRFKHLALKGGWSTTGGRTEERKKGFSWGT